MWNHIQIVDQKSKDVYEIVHILDVVHIHDF